MTMKTVMRGHRIRAYPNQVQLRLLDRWFGIARWLWNTALEIRSEAYRTLGLRLTGMDLSRWLTQWKRTEGHEWLAAAPATCSTQVLHDQDAAFRRFFTGRWRYPRFKARAKCGGLRFQGVGVAWLQGTDAAFGELRRQLTYKSEWHGKILGVIDRYYPSSKTCSECQHRLRFLQLNERRWKCPECGADHDRDTNAARNLLAEGLRQLAGRDDRDLRVDARGACPEEQVLAQVLADEARSGHRNQACIIRA
jgi:transposase